MDTQRIFYTNRDDNTLFYTDDLGATIQEVILDAQPIEGSYTGSGFTWDQIYTTAHAPEVVDGIYRMYLSTGDSSDYTTGVVPVYESHDQGNTWKFTHYEPFEYPRQ